MPGLFALAQHPALQATQAMLLPGEVLFAFLDDLCFFDILQARLQAHAGMQVNLGKARAWNAGGVLPPGVDAFGTAEDPSWVGDLSLPPHQQGFVVLGSPLGSHAFRQAFLAEKRASQDTLLQRIPAVPHLQSAWLILLLCGAPRANYLLRILPPCHTHAFAREHDAAVLRLLSAEERLELDALQRPRAQLPLARGGMGLRSAGLPSACRGPPSACACRRGALLVVSQPFHCSSHPRAPYGRKKKKNNKNTLLPQGKACDSFELNLSDFLADRAGPVSQVLASRLSALCMPWRTFLSRTLVSVQPGCPAKGGRQRRTKR